MGSNIGVRVPDDVSDPVSLSPSLSVEIVKLLWNFFIPPIGSILVYLRFLLEVEVVSGIPVHKLH